MQSRGIVGVVLAGLTLAGCDDLRVQGCAVAGVVGAGVGALIDGGRGAAIGAGAGCAAGAVAGHVLQNERESYASAEDELKGRTDAARKDAADFRTASSSYQRAAEENRRKLTGLRQQVAAGRTLTDQQRSDVAVAKQQEAEMAEQVRRGEQSIAALDRQIADLKRKGQNTAELERQRSSIADSTQRTRTSLNTVSRALQGIEA